MRAGGRVTKSIQRWKGAAGAFASIALVAVAIGGCKRSTPSEQTSENLPSPAATVTATTPPDILNGSPPLPVNDQEQIATLEQAYAGATDADQKTDLVAQIADIGGTEAIRALGRLLQNETGLQPKLELLSAIMGVEDDSAEKLSALAIGLQPSQPQTVRALAVDAVAMMNTPGANEILEGLRLDGDPEIRSQAEDALDHPEEEEEEEVP